MLALRVKQKEAEFYLASWPAADLLRRVRFQLRTLGEEAAGRRRRRRGPDRVEEFIETVIGSKEGFQRRLMAGKVREIASFIGNSDAQPPLPGTVLLYTPERLEFKAHGGAAGNLAEPVEPFTIVDGQHRLAGLKEHLRGLSREAGREDEGDDLYVPVAVFDGKAADFAAEMFVIVNSTHSKIAKSLLIDLMDNVKGAKREQRVAARVVRQLYEDQRSPLRYRVNRLGGRSGQPKWILQSQLYNEVFRLMDPQRAPEHHAFCVARLRLGELGERPHGQSDKLDAVSDTVFGLVADWYRGAARALGGAWGSDKHMVTVPVTLQAMLRVLGDELRPGGLVDHYVNAGHEPAVLHGPLERAWGGSDLAQDFRKKGFYERFAAKGAPERVRLLHKRLGELLRGAGGSERSVSPDRNGGR